MEVLVIGSGGREHAIVHCLKKSAKISKLYAAPGNAGIAAEAECLPIGAMEFEKIAAFLAEHPAVGLTVVAPDNPLAEGLVDYLEERGHRAFGPRKNAAVIEGSKIFSKNLMKKYGIPTAGYESFDDYQKACAYIETVRYPVVVKADGLAFGKGVIICENKGDAEKALQEIMLDCIFGESNTKIIVEEFLTGREVSLLVFTDGKTVKPMLSSQDHKKIFDGDKGPNTGGMGAFSPSKYFTKDIEQRAMDEIVYPTVHAMNKEGRTFKGVLYFGLMIVNGKPYTLEYNARFGDPETQAILPLLKTDLFDIMNAVIDGTLDEVNIEWKNETAVTVVLASGGYPGAFTKGKAITVRDGIKDAEMYHAGTAFQNGKLVTSGGRVLAVTACGKDMIDAREKAYAAAEHISFDGMFYRKDIGLV